VAAEVTIGWCATGIVPPVTYPASIDSKTVDGTRPTRPGTVVASAVCFWLAAALLLAQAPQVVYDLATIASTTHQAGALAGASASDVSDEVSFGRLIDVASLLALVVLAACLAVSGIGFLRGRHGARVAGLVAGGLVLVCCALSTVGTLVGGQQFDQSAFDQKLIEVQEAQVPGWLSWLTIVALAVYPLLFAGLTLLVVPASNRYFRPYAGYYVLAVPPVAAE
jgi:hypothetical protein